MARKKAAYYTLVKFLQSELNIGEDEAKIDANDVYDEWKKDESRDIVELFKSTSVTVIKEEVLVAGEEEAVKEPLTEVAEEEYAANAKTVAVEYAAPAKLDWEKYLEDNPDLVCLNKETAKRWNVIDSEAITKKKEREVLAGLKDDKLKIILLQFFKDITHIEGFKSIDYFPLGPSDPFYCGTKCVIEWANGQKTSGLADAHAYNTSSFTKYYSAAIAENRSFVRAVKAYFNISIVGADEIGETPKDGFVPTGKSPQTEGVVDPTVVDAQEKEKLEAPIGPHVTLKRVAKEKLGITEFEDFVKYLRKQYADATKEGSTIAPWITIEEAADWKEYGAWESVKKGKIAELIGKIKAL